MKKTVDKFIKDMDELIEESLTDEFFDHGDSTAMMDDMADTFKAFKKKITKTGETKAINLPV
jgi:hypothetical protein